MEFTCPICGDMFDCSEDLIEDHMVSCCVLVEADNLPSDFCFCCACGADVLKQRPTTAALDMIEHLANTPHDWPKILVEREMRSM